MPLVHDMILSEANNPQQFDKYLELDLHTFRDLLAGNSKIDYVNVNKILFLLIDQINFCPSNFVVFFFLLTEILKVLKDILT